MPLWLDGGPNEKQEKQRIKHAVKKNFRQKKRLQARQPRGHNRNTNQERSLSKPATDGIHFSGISQSECLVITAMDSYSTHQQMPIQESHHRQY
jgi:hypothetical protein